MEHLNTGGNGAKIFVNTHEGMNLDTHDEGKIVKNPNEEEVSQGPSSKAGSEILEIDHDAENRLVRKLDLHIIPVVMLLYLLSFLDR